MILSNILSTFITIFISVNIFFKEETADINSLPIIYNDEKKQTKMKKIVLIITLINFSVFQAQIVNIPDANFKIKLLNHNPIIDLNNDNEIQVTEAESFNGSLAVSSGNISDLTGIEAFINITELNCGENNLTNLKCVIKNQAPISRILKCLVNQQASENFISVISLRLI